MDATSGELYRSGYNYFVDRHEGIMAFNARTGVFALLAPDVAEILKGKEPIREVRDREELLELGFLHRGDELQQIIDQYQGHKRTAKLSLTLVPTLACNFSCDYCYQNEYREDRVMSPETQEATLRFVKGLVRGGLREMSCTWYGGEPLLEAQIVVDLSIRLRQEVEACGGTIVGFNIVTNGTRLDRNTAMSLVDAGVSSAQVSFDSLFYEPPSKRGVIEPDGRPSPILTNLVQAADLLKLKVRVNVSAANKGDIARILEILRDHGLGSYVYLARVHDLDGEAGCFTDSLGRRHQLGKATSLPIIQPDKDTLSRREFANFERAASFSDPASLSTMAKRLTPKKHFCGATSGNLYVIDPAGYISRCWHSAGSPSESMGNVHDVVDALDDTDVALRWDHQTPFTYPTCSGCRVLPLCMGGCSHPRVFMDAKKPPCEAIKYQIQHFVETLGRRLPIAADTLACVGQSPRNEDAS